MPWAVTAVGFFATFVLIRIGQTAWAHVSAQLAANRLRKSGRRVEGTCQMFLVPSDETFAFTTGVFSPTIIISSAAWDSLGAAERAALIAHEHAHIAHGDLWKRATLGLLACFSVPIFARRALDLWELASERVCDRVAARRVDKPSIVANAILLLARSPTNRPAPAVAVFAAACNVTERIQCLLGQGPDGKPAARNLAVAILATFVAAATACVVFAESLHHIFETILG